MDSVAEAMLKAKLTCEDYVVTGQRKEGRIEVVEAEFEPCTPPSCQKCGCERMWKHGKRWRRVSYGEFNGEPVDLLVKVERYRCPKCKSTRTPEIPNVRRRARLSEGLKKYIVKALSELKSTAFGIARFFGLAWTTVWRVAKSIAAFEPCDLQCVKNLCIDEVYFRWPHRYMTVLTDADRGRILGVVYGKGYAAAKALFEAIPPSVRERIDTLSTDFAGAHRRAAYETLPNAFVVADRFHLERIAKRFIREARKTGQEKEFRLMKEAYGALRSILDKGGRKGLEELPLWIARYRRLSRSERLGSLRSFVRLVDKWEIEIEGYLETGCSNGVAEAVNRNISLLRRKACGYTNVDNFIRRILSLNPSLHH